jgi:hypothetical protein
MSQNQRTSVQVSYTRYPTGKTLCLQRQFTAPRWVSNGNQGMPKRCQLVQKNYAISDGWANYSPVTQSVLVLTNNIIGESTQMHSTVVTIASCAYGKHALSTCCSLH